MSDTSSGKVLQREYSPKWLFFRTTIYVYICPIAYRINQVSQKVVRKPRMAYTHLPGSQYTPPPDIFHTCRGQVVDTSVAALPDSFKSRFPHVIAYRYLQKVPDQFAPWQSWLWHVLSARVHASQSVAILATGCLSPFTHAG